MEKYFFYHFFRQVEIFFKKKIRKNPNLTDPSCTYEGGSPPSRGVENVRQDPGYHFCAFILKNNFFKKVSCSMPPTGPSRVRIFLKIFGPPKPLLYIFLLLYYCVPLYIFTVFVHIFFNFRLFVKRGGCFQLRSHSCCALRVENYRRV